MRSLVSTAAVLLCLIAALMVSPVRESGGRAAPELACAQCAPVVSGDLGALPVGAPDHYVMPAVLAHQEYRCEVAACVNHDPQPALMTVTHERDERTRDARGPVTTNPYGARWGATGPRSGPSSGVGSA